MDLAPGTQARVSHRHYNVAVAGATVTVEEAPNTDGMVKVSRRIETWVHVDELHEGSMA